MFINTNKIYALNFIIQFTTKLLIQKLSNNTFFMHLSIYTCRKKRKKKKYQLTCFLHLSILHPCKQMLLLLFFYVATCFCRSLLTKQKLK